MAIPHRRRFASSIYFRHRHRAVASSEPATYHRAILIIVSPSARSPSNKSSSSSPDILRTGQRPYLLAARSCRSWYCQLARNATGRLVMTTRIACMDGVMSQWVSRSWGFLVGSTYANPREFAECRSRPASSSTEDLLMSWLSSAVVVTWYILLALVVRKLRGIGAFTTLQHQKSNGSVDTRRLISC